MGYRLYNALVASVYNALNNGAQNLLYLLINLLYRWALGSAPALWSDVLRSTNLAGTYANGSSGVGATLTKASAGAFATEDGVAPYLGMLVLLTGQTSRFENGPYKLTRIGDASSVAWQLTRFSGWDASAEMITGSIFYIRKGTTYGGTVYAYTGASSPTVGTTALNFAQDSLIRTFSAALSGSSWTPVRVLTAAALPANTYAAATQTKTANANGTLTVDGVLLAVGDRLWDKDAATGSERGLFEVIDAGSGGTPWKAARAADANASADFVDGKTFTVREGTQAHTAWQFTTNAPFVLDTDTPAIARETNVMRTDEAQTVTGAKLFADGMARIANAAGTFYSALKSAATANRNVTFPDAAGYVELMTAYQNLAGAGVIDLASRLTLSTIAAAGVVQTLADGVAGQRKFVKLGTIGTPGTDTLVVTPANGGPWTLDVLNDWILIEFDGTNWILIADGRHAASGIYTFVSGIVVKVQIALRNAGDTFAHTITSLATAARALAIPDRAGTVEVLGAADTQIGAGALSVSTPTSFVESAAAGVVFTLAAGAFAGQRKFVQLTTLGTPGTDTAVITPGAGGPWTLSYVGDGILIEWNGAAWALVGDFRVNARLALTGGTVSGALALQNANTLTNDDNATGAVALRLGATATEGWELRVFDGVISPAAIETNVVLIPANSIILSAQANVQAALTGGGTTATWSLGTAATPNKYGTAGYPSPADSLAQNSKSDWLPTAFAHLSSAEQIVLTGAATGGAADGNTALTVGSVRVRIVYQTLNSLDNA